MGGGWGVTNGSSTMGGVPSSCIHTCPWVGEVAYWLMSKIEMTPEVSPARRQWSWGSTLRESTISPSNSVRGKTPVIRKYL